MAGCSGSIEKKTETKLTDTVIKKKEAKLVITNGSANQKFLYYPAMAIVDAIICKQGVYTVKNENGDKPDDSIVVAVLKSPIAVVNEPGVDTTDYEANFPNEYTVDTVQLVLHSFNGLEKARGQEVRLKGTFFHGDNGNHYTPVLMDVMQVKIGNDSTLLSGNE